MQPAVPELVVSLKNRELRRHAISRRDTRIGRDPSNDLVIDNAGVSRHHALVRLESGAFVVLDDGSANGLFVNGEPCRRAVLRDGDRIQIGKYVLTLSLPGWTAPAELPEAPPTEARRSVVSADGTTRLSAEELARVVVAIEAEEPAPAAPARRSSVAPPGKKPFPRALAVALAVLVVVTAVLAGMRLLGR